MYSMLQRYVGVTVAVLVWSDKLYSARTIYFTLKSGAYQCECHMSRERSCSFNVCNAISVYFMELRNFFCE